MMAPNEFCVIEQDHSYGTVLVGSGNREVSEGGRFRSGSLRWGVRRNDLNRSIPAKLGRGGFVALRGLLVRIPLAQASQILDAAACTAAQISLC